MVDWSYELLDEEEGRLFRCLAVLAQEFDLSAAEAAGGQGSWAALGRLVDKSMVVAVPGSGLTRCRLLETLHAYGMERRFAAGESDAARARHFAYFATAVEAAYDHRMTTGSDAEIVGPSRATSTTYGGAALGRDGRPHRCGAPGRGRCGRSGDAEGSPKGGPGSSGSCPAMPNLTATSRGHSWPRGTWPCGRWTARRRCGLSRSTMRCAPRLATSPARRGLRTTAGCRHPRRRPPPGEGLAGEGIGALRPLREQLRAVPSGGEHGTALGRLGW